MVFCTRKLNNKKHPPKVIRSRNYKNYNPEKLCDDIKSIDSGSLYECTNVNDALELFNSAVVAVFDRHAPVTERIIKWKPFPWISHDTKRAMNRRDQIHRKAKKHNRFEDWLAAIQTAPKLHQQ